MAEPRLIDANALNERFDKRIKWLQLDIHDQYSFGLYHGAATDKDLIGEAPTVDAVPVVHGHFVHDGPRFAGGVDWWHCSNCGRLAPGVETRFDYCPKCGARMDGGDDGETD